MSPEKPLEYNGPFGKKRPRSFFEKQGFLARRSRRSQGCWDGDAFSLRFKCDGVSVNGYCVLCGRALFLSKTLSRARETLNLIDTKAAQASDPKEVYAAFLLMLEAGRENSPHSMADLAAALPALEAVKEMLSEAEKSVLRENGSGFVNVWDYLDAKEFSQFLSCPGDDSALRSHEAYYCSACTMAFCPRCFQRGSEVVISIELGRCPECLERQCRLLL